MIPKAPRKIFEDLPGGKKIGCRAKNEKRSGYRLNSKVDFTNATGRTRGSACVSRLSRDGFHLAQMIDVVTGHSFDSNTKGQLAPLRMSGFLREGIA